MEDKITKMKYCIYCRKSTESEDRQVLSIDSQTDKAKEIADRLGVRISDKDLLSESKSAKITANRPKFKEMVDRIQSGNLNGIIVWHADRLSRNAIDSAILIDLMDREKLVEIVTPTQTFKNTPIDKFMFSLMCNQAKMENDKKGVDVVRGLEKKASMGIFPNQPPFGYTNDKYAEKGNKKIQSDTERLALIKKMFELMLTGNYSTQQILHKANDEWGFRTPKGKEMSKSTIYRMFTNTFYYGKYEFPIGSGKWYQGIHETIITEEEYDKIQFLLGHKGRPRPKSHIFNFTGMMRCGECRAMITAETKTKQQKNGNVHTYIYYHCTKRKNPNCSQGCIEEKILKKQIIKEIDSIEIPPEFHTFAMQWFKKENEKESVGRNAVIKSNEKAYKTCLTKIDGLTDMRAGGEITAEEFAKKKIELLADKKKLDDLFGNTSKRVERWLENADEMLTFIEEAKYKFDKGTIETRRSILSTLGSDLILKDKIFNIDIEKSIFPIKRITKDIKAISERLEPLKGIEKQKQFNALCEKNPILLGG
ncbi:MAG TPA: recombinase family protein [Candidatus Paceibacterota bacterium]|nr:recombinase family protein [Candidatus Paceibacterota bacterium]